MQNEAGLNGSKKSKIPPGRRPLLAGGRNLKSQIMTNDCIAIKTGWLGKSGFSIFLPSRVKTIPIENVHYEVRATISTGVLSAMPSFSSVVPVET